MKANWQKGGVKTHKQHVAKSKSKSKTSSSKSSKKKSGGGGSSKKYAQNPADVAQGIDASKTTYDPVTGKESSVTIKGKKYSVDYSSGKAKYVSSGGGSSPSSTQATTTSKQLTKEQATKAGLKVVGGKIQVQTAGDWVKYARATGMSSKEYSQTLRTYNPETAGDWMRLARKEKWKGKKFKTELQAVYEPNVLFYETVKKKGYGGVISAGKTKKFTPKEEEYKTHLESQAKKPSKIKEKLSYAYSVSLKPYEKPAKEFYTKQSKKFKESHGYKHTIRPLPTREQVQPYADTMGEFWKKIPDTSLGKHTTKDKQAFALKSKAQKESQGEFIKGFVPALVSYPKEHPVKTAIFFSAPLAGRVIGSGAKVVGGRALIKASPYLPVTGTKALHLSGKGLSFGTKAGIAGMYAYDKKSKWKSTTDSYSKGKFFGETSAELGLLYGGYKATSPIGVPWEKEAEYLRGRIAVRTSPRFATKRSVGQIDEYAKLSKELYKVDIEPTRNYPFKEVKGITKKQIKGYKKFAVSKEMEVIGGSGTQATYMKDPKLQQTFFKYKKIGDIDPITKSGKVPSSLQSISDPHKYSERYVFRRSPFTKDIKYTPRGEPVYSFGEQSGRLFSGMTTQRQGTFYRADKDSARLLFQYKVAESEGLASPVAKGSFKYVTEGYQTLPKDSYFSKPSSFFKKSGFTKKTPQDIKFGDVEFSNLFTAKTSALPSLSPSSFPSPSFSPSKSSSLSPSKSPSFSPSTSPNKSPNFNPIKSPSLVPMRSPSFSPSRSPSISPSFSPSPSPSISPSFSPSPSPSAPPSFSPSRSPSISPSFSPSTSPPTPATPSLFLPRFKVGAPTKPKIMKPSKQKKKYAPTLRAVFLGIKGKRKGLLSGLEERGL